LRVQSRNVERFSDRGARRRNGVQSSQYLLAIIGINHAVGGEPVEPPVAGPSTGSGRTDYLTAISDTKHWSLCRSGSGLPAFDAQGDQDWLIIGL
jgi:hypothetical protein